TFRWKGENVSTVEIAEIITGFPGVLAAAVYGVTIPEADGQAGMAALVVSDEFELSNLRNYVAELLPSYARPVFLRIMAAIVTTETFKHGKKALADQGYDPALIKDPLYFYDPGKKIFVSLTEALYEQIRCGKRRI